MYESIIFAFSVYIHLTKNIAKICYSELKLYCLNLN